VKRRLLLAGMASALAARAQDIRIPARPVPGVVRADWPSASPEAVGLDPASVATLPARLATRPRVKALVVIRDGSLVAEYYRGSIQPEDLHNVASVTKSVTATLIGIALGEGVFSSLDQRAAELLPPAMLPAADPRFGRVTLRHLLTMSSGLKRENRFGLARADNILKHGLAAEPGSLFQYDSAPQHLLSVILAHRTGISTAHYAEQKLFAPLGIARYNWFADDGGYTYGSHDLFLSPRDMARIGQLHLDEGRWRGRVVVGADFVRAAVRGHIETGVAAAPTYGYSWRQTLAHENASAYVAVGFGGQYIFVVPSQRLVVAANSDDDFSGEGVGFVRELVLPAVWKSRG
jgi:CubicO group peptidase (beta-lactamase class C family)